jgi:hypothetical protein
VLARTANSDETGGHGSLAEGEGGRF